MQRTQGPVHNPVNLTAWNRAAGRRFSPRRREWREALVLLVVGVGAGLAVGFAFGAGVEVATWALR